MQILQIFAFSLTSPEIIYCMKNLNLLQIPNTEWLVQYVITEWAKGFHKAT